MEGNRFLYLYQIAKFKPISTLDSFEHESLLCLLVAVVGFKMEGDVMLQEGGGSARICAGFDIDDMDGIIIDSGVDFVFIIADLSPIIPGTGHGKYCQIYYACG